jgi:hypothetical protein
MSSGLGTSIHGCCPFGLFFWNRHFVEPAFPWVCISPNGFLLHVPQFLNILVCSTSMNFDGGKLRFELLKFRSGQFSIGGA